MRFAINLAFDRHIVKRKNTLSLQNNAKNYPALNALPHAERIALHVFDDALRTRITPLVTLLRRTARLTSLLIVTLRASTCNAIQNAINPSAVNNSDVYFHMRARNAWPVIRRARRAFVVVQRALHTSENSRAALLFELALRTIRGCCDSVPCTTKKVRDFFPRPRKTCVQQVRRESFSLFATSQREPTRVIAPRKVRCANHKHDDLKCSIARRCG